MNADAKAQPKELRTRQASEGIVIRKCGALEEFHACVGLQREVWGEADLEIEPVTMFVVASVTGGQVLGAFDGEKLVGYTLAVVGLRQRVTYLHSHQTAVSATHRNRGVGRMLKLFQREEALGRGIRLVEWTFDPLELPAELEQWKQNDAQRVRAVQKRVREEFTQWFAREYAAIGVRAGQKGQAYLLAPWSDF